MDRLAAMDGFVRVIDAGSFSGAAKQLHVGQSAVSKTITQLEERLSARLLVRSTHGLMPTEAGRKFYERARRSIEEADEAELAARDTAGNLAGRLRIHATVAFGNVHLIPHLPNFLAQNPALDVDIILDDRNIDLVEAGIDIALRAGHLRYSTPTARNIGRCKRHVLGTSSYFRAAGVPRTPADLVTHQVITYDEPLGGAEWTFRRGAAEVPVRVRGRVNLNTAVGVRECVFADLGLTIASEWMFAFELKAKTIIPVLVEWSLPPVEAWVIFPAGRRVSAKARAFASFMESQMGNLGSEDSQNSNRIEQTSMPAGQDDQFDHSNSSCQSSEVLRQKASQTKD